MNDKPDKVSNCPECGATELARNNLEEFICVECGYLIESKTNVSDRDRYETPESDNSPEWRVSVTGNDEESTSFDIIDDGKKHILVIDRGGKKHTLDIIGDRGKYIHNIDNDSEKFTLKIDDEQPDYYITVDHDRRETHSGKKLEVNKRLPGTVSVKTRRHLRGEEGAGYAFVVENINNFSIEKKEDTDKVSIFNSSTSPITIFEIAPGKGGQIHWIYEIEDPSTTFSDCQTQEDVSDKLKSPNINTDEQITTCGYTLVLENPEDPHEPVSPPEKPISIKIIRGSGQDREYEFYQIDDPVSTFGEAWGDTHEMYDAIVEESLDPILRYDNVSLIFQRSYGEL